jgi:hypothetical protein
MAGECLALWEVATPEEGDAFLVRMQRWETVLLMEDDPLREILLRNASPLQPGTPVGSREPRVTWRRCGQVDAQRRYGMLCTSGVPSDTGTLTGYRTIGVRTCYCCSQAATRER